MITILILFVEKSDKFPLNCRMLSYDPCDPYHGFFIDTYKLPSGCSCHIPDGPAPATPEAARSAAPEASAAPVVPIVAEAAPSEPEPVVSG